MNKIEKIELTREEVLIALGWYYSSYSSSIIEGDELADRLQKFLSPKDKENY